MVQAKKGDSVKVHYTGKLEDGSVFDSSVKREPIEFKIGDGRLIPAFEEAVIGMEPGDKKQFTVRWDKAYGPHLAELITVIPRDKLPGDLKLELGHWLQQKGPDGKVVFLMIIGVTEKEVTLDANHPLAGKDLIFDIELVKIG